MKDNEGSLWLTTLGNGVIKLSNTEIKTFHFRMNNPGSQPIFSIVPVKKQH